MKNSSTGMMKKIAAIGMLGAGLIFNPGTGSKAANMNQVNTDIDIDDNSSSKETKINKLVPGGGSSYSPKYKRGNLNQRQYRKKCRQNPSCIKSKKHRSKN